MSETPAPRTAVATCSRCGEGLVPDDRFCGGCGAKVNPCRSCGNMLVAGNRNCPQCGSAVDLTKLTAQLSKPGLTATSDADWDAILARVQEATLGELHFITPLGRGGMAAVYLAEDIRLRRKVAVKMILPELMADERMVRRFQEEAQTVANLRHANIVRVFAVREAAGIHFFTMDYIEGCSLEAILETSGPLPIPVVRSVLGQVASALGNAHRQGVFHRDVKPANILIDTDGNAYVTDFGIAKVSKSIGKSKTLTQFGAVVGTPAYISPEQCLSRPVTGASDQYSLGVVAYELVAGHPPFDDQNSFALMRSHTDEPVPPLRERRSACPPELEAAILKMLSKKPEDRFGTMGEAIAALEATPLPEDNPMRSAFAELAVPIILPPDSHTPPIDNRATAPALVPLKEPVKEPARPTVAMIGISPPPDVIEVGDEFALSASTRDMGGVTLPDMKVTWHSSDEGIATIDASSGAVRAVAAGTAELSATVGRAKATVMCTVEARGASAITITPLTSPVHVGDRPQLSAVVKDRKGAVATNLSVTWRSEAPKVATVSAAGLVEGIGAGEAEIVATSGSVSASYRVQVKLQPASSIKLTVPDGPVTVGDSFKVVARVFDAKGALLTGRAVALVLDDEEIASLGQDGVVQAKEPGTVHVTATCEGVRLSCAITIQRAPVHAVQFASPPASVCEGDAFVLTAMALDAQGRSLTGRAMRWASLTPELAAVSSTGSVEAIAPGTARITCTIEGKSVTATIAVKQQPVAVLQVSTPPRSVTIGDSFRLVATPVDKHGAHLVGRATTWRTDNPAIASVTAVGLVTANATGTVQISATCESVSAAVPIKVAPAPVTSVTVTGLPGSLDVGKHAQVRAAIIDARGNEVERPVVWTSTAPSVATVSATGDVAALTAGQTRIVAQVEGIESASELTVNRKIIGTPRPPSAGDAAQPEQPAQVTHPSRKVAKPGAATATDLPGLYPTEQPFDAPEGGKAAEARKQKADEAAALQKQSEEADVAARAAAVARAEAARKERVDAEARADAERKQRQESESRAGAARKEIEDEKARTEQAAAAQKKAQDDAQAKQRDAADRKKAQDVEVQRAAKAAAAKTAAEKAAAATISQPDKAKDEKKKSVPVAAIAAGVVIVLAGAAFALKGSFTGTTDVVSSAATQAQAPSDSAASGGTAESSGGTPATTNIAPAPAVKLLVTEVKLSGVPSQVIAGDAFQVVGTALAKGGVEIPGGSAVTYASSDARIATVNATGRVVAASAGRVTISASSDGVTSRESFVVAPKPANAENTVRLVLTAPPPIRVGESAPVRATASPAGTSTSGLAWTSSNESVARVDARTGEVTGVSRGKATITARLGKVSQGDDVEILPAEVVAVQVPASHNLKESESARLTATPTDKQGQPLRGRDVSWSSDRPQVVSVTEDGVITGRSGGSATVSATSEGRVGRVAVRVEPKPVPVAPVVVAKVDPPPITTPTRDVTGEANAAAKAAAAQQLSARPAEVLQALSNRDAGRAAALFSTESAEDQRNTGGLRDKLSRKEAELKAADLQAGSPQMGDNEGTIDFKMRLSWITAVGREKSAIISFQARTQRTAAGWRLAAVKVLNEVK